jgi:nucleotide-binding universal stress UspA family protein
MYTRILVATGGSPWSDAAVSSAIAIAAHTGAELRVLTVLVNSGMMVNPDMLGDGIVVTEIIERDGQETLARASAQAAAADVACEAFSAWGHVPETILWMATEQQCDLIIVGSRGLSGWKRLMLGSTANAVAAKALQPVLVVKQPVSPDLPFGSRVLVATGGSPWSDAAVQYAVRLAQTQHLELCVLHVDRGRPQRGEDPAASEGKNLLAEAEIRAAMAGVAYEGVLAEGSVPEAILRTAAEKQCAAIILGSRGLTGWKRLMVGSIANAVTAKSTLPVLLVKRFFTG